MGQSLLPMPTHYTPAKGSFKFTSNIEMKVEQGAPTPTVLLNEALTPAAQSKAEGKAVVLVRPYVGAPTAESYKLRVTADSIVIDAASQDALTRCGATLLQLRKDEQSLYCAEIEDHPAYAWRGVMLDVSRHFFTLDHIRKQIDIMALYKLNTLHLHLTDAAGWRM